MSCIDCQNPTARSGFNCMLCQRNLCWTCEAPLSAEVYNRWGIKTIVRWCCAAACQADYQRTSGGHGWTEGAFPGKNSLAYTLGNTRTAQDIQAAIVTALGWPGGTPITPEDLLARIREWMRCDELMESSSYPRDIWFNKLQEMEPSRARTAELGNFLLDAAEDLAPSSDSDRLHAAYRAFNEPGKS